MQELTLLSRSPELKFGLSGEIDSQNADEFYREVTELFASNPAPVVLDCSKLEFIDSTTLGILVKLHKTVAAAGYRLVLQKLQPKLKKLFVICALDKLMEIEE